jgi:hypothetical protein
VGVSEVISVVVGFILGHVPRWLDRHRRIKTHWHSLRAEALLCKKAAEAFLAAKIAAPLYRLPVVAFERAFPILITDGSVSEQELMALSRFVSVVQEFNRGLEDASGFVKANDNEHLRKAHGRNILKAEALLTPANNEPALALEALRIIDAKIAQPRWKY